MQRVSAVLLGISLAVPAFLTGGSALAEPQAWMKKGRPNELAFMVTVNDECPVEAARFERFVAKSFHEQWIRRIRVRANEPFLRIEVWCQRGELTPFTVVAQFVQFDESYANLRTLGPSYEAAGSAPFYGLRDNALRVASLALEDHIGANFDL